MTNIELAEISLKQAALIETLFKELEVARADVKVLNCVNASLVKENNSLTDILSRFCKNAFV